MKKLILISTLILVALVLVACSGSNDLLNTTWQWTSLKEAQPASQSVVPNPENYTIVFEKEDTFTATADCNQISGTYLLKGKKLSIMPGPSTMAECGPDSLSDMYVALLSQVTSYEMDGDTLILVVGDGNARMAFQNGGSVK